MTEVLAHHANPGTQDGRAANTNRAVRKDRGMEIARSQLRHRIGVLAIALAMLVAIPLAALATTREGAISCAGPGTGHARTPPA